MWSSRVVKNGERNAEEGLDEMEQTIDSVRDSASSKKQAKRRRGREEEVQNEGKVRPNLLAAWPAAVCPNPALAAPAPLSR